MSCKFQRIGPEIENLFFRFRVGGGGGGSAQSLLSKIYRQNLNFFSNKTNNISSQQIKLKNNFIIELYFFYFPEKLQ